MTVSVGSRDLADMGLRDLKVFGWLKLTDGTKKEEEGKLAFLISQG